MEPATFRLVAQCLNQLRHPIHPGLSCSYTKHIQIRRDIIVKLNSSCEGSWGYKLCVGQKCDRTEVQTAVGPLSTTQDDALIRSRISQKTHTHRKRRQVGAHVLLTHSHFCSLDKIQPLQIHININTAKISQATH